MKKAVIAIDISTKGKGGGPYTSTRRIIDSGLNQNYDFRVLKYDTDLGKGISIKRILDLTKQLKKINPDIAHFTGLQLSGFHIIVACKLAGVRRTVVTIRGTSRDALDFNPLKKFVLAQILEPLTLLFSTKIYCVSEYVASLSFLDSFRHKVYGAIYNFPPQELYNIDAIDAKKELEVNEQQVVVGTVARIVKDKGYHILSEVILRFKGIKGIKFIIVGEGSYLKEMKHILKNQVDDKQVLFLGHRDDVQRILKCCDIFVLPTLHETLSVALLEASAERLALVASRTGGVPEIVEDGYNGLLVEPGNSQKLYDAINYLLCNPDKIKAFGNNAKKRLDVKFSREEIVSKIDAVYTELLAT